VKFVNIEQGLLNRHKKIRHPIREYRIFLKTLLLGKP